MKRPPRDEQEFLIDRALALLPAALATMDLDDPFSCIRNHRILFDVFRAFGLRVEPFPCRIAIFNPVGSRLLTEWGRIPQNREEEEQWHAAGAFFISVTHGEPLPNRFAGHLMLRVEDRWLVDSAIQQCHRPERGLVIDKPLKARIPREQLHLNAWNLDSENGNLLVIARDDNLRGYGNVTFDQAAGWQRREPWNTLTAVLTRRLEAERKQLKRS